MFAYGETVTVQSAALTTDDYGNTVEDWGAPTETPIEGVGVEPRPAQSETHTETRNAITSGFTLYLPAGSVVNPQDRIEVRGSVYPVLGEPAEWRNPFTGWEPGMVVQVGRIDG